jgi:hypothetical protein
MNAIVSVFERLVETTLAKIETLSIGSDDFVRPLGQVYLLLAKSYCRLNYLPLMVPLRRWPKSTGKYCSFPKIGSCLASPANVLKGLPVTSQIQIEFSIWQTQTLGVLTQSRGCQLVSDDHDGLA